MSAEFMQQFGFLLPEQRVLRVPIQQHVQLRQRLFHLVESAKNDNVIESVTGGVGSMLETKGKEPLGLFKLS